MRLLSERGRRECEGIDGGRKEVRARKREGGERKTKERKREREKDVL